MNPSQNFKLQALLVLFLLQPQTLQSQGTEHSIQIYGDRKVSVTIQNGMPVPAEDKFIKIQAAGLMMSKDKTDPSKQIYHWAFGLSSKTDRVIKSIRIDELSKNKPDRPVIEDLKPQFKDKYWSNQTDGRPTDEATAPWLHDKKNSQFLYKFTIDFENGDPSTLVQMAVISNMAKIVLLMPVPNKPKK